MKILGRTKEENLTRNWNLGKRNFREVIEKQNKMGSAPAQIPTSFGQELRACLRCRLVKTYDQVLWGSFTVSIRVFLLPFSKFLGFWFLLLSSISVQQFRDAGCENCPFFKMEEDHERIVEVTTPNFNGYFLRSKPFDLVFLLVSWVDKSFAFVGTVSKNF